MLNLVNKNCKYMIEGRAKINSVSIKNCGIDSVISLYGAGKVMSKLRYLRLKFRQETGKYKSLCRNVTVEQESDLDTSGSDEEFPAFNENLASSSVEPDSSEAITVKKPTMCDAKRGSKESFSPDTLNLVSNNCKHMIEGSARINLDSITSCGINDVISQHGAGKVMSKIRYLRLKFRSQ